jgi:hypothetical protein
VRSRESPPGNLLANLALAWVAVPSAGCGVRASFDRCIGAKLFQGFAFDFWDPERPALLFYAENIAIPALYAVAARWTSKILKAMSLRHGRSIIFPGVKSLE